MQTHTDTCFHTRVFVFEHTFWCYAICVPKESITSKHALEPDDSKIVFWEKRHTMALHYEKQMQSCRNYGVWHVLHAAFIQADVEQPGGQTVHAAEPAAEYFPDGQFVQVAASAAL
jgi:hypothetical protein